jgi:hypothetical protein
MQQDQPTLARYYLELIPCPVGHAYHLAAYLLTHLAGPRGLRPAAMLANVLGVVPELRRFSQVELSVVSNNDSSRMGWVGGWSHKHAHVVRNSVPAPHINQSLRYVFKWLGYTQS